MKYFLFPIILGIVLIAGINLYVDPASRWKQTRFNFDANWKSDQCWIHPLAMDERKPRIQHIESLSKIDLLGLGSSRILNVDTSMFPAAVHFYNASVSGATMWDHVALWEKFKQQGNIPRHLILYLDTWNFNKTTYQKYRWILNMPLVMAFLNTNDDKYDGRRAVQISTVIDYLSGSFYELCDLLSPGLLNASIQEFNSYRITGALNVNYVVPLMSRPADSRAWRSDGSGLYRKEEEQPKSLAEITEIGKNTGLGSMYVYMKDWETDINAIRLLDYLLTDTARYGVDVLIVQPPFQHEIFKILKTTPDYKDIPGRYATIVQSLLLSHKNASYCDALDPSQIGCKETEFVDSSHTLRSCAHKVITYCLSKVPHWYGSN